MTPVVLLDADEVLYNFQVLALREMSRVLGHAVAPHDFTEWDIFHVLTPPQRDDVFGVIEQPGFCLTIPPYEAAQQAVRRLRELADVYVVTSPFHSPTWVHERQEALRRDFGFTSDQIVHTKAKYLVQGQVFVDDNPKHVVKWCSRNPNGRGFLWHIPNTRTLGHDDLRVTSWQTVIDHVNSISNRG